MYVNVVTKLLVECNGAILPLHLPLKIPDHLLPHPDPHPVDQVQLIMHCLTAPPLLPPVGLKRLPGAIIKPELAIPDTKAVKPGSIEHPIIRVKSGDGVIQLLDLRKPVVVARWRGPIILKPGKLGRVKEGGNSKLVPGTWMVKVLGIDYLLEVPNGVHDTIFGSSLDKVIQTSN